MRAGGRAMVLRGHMCCLSSTPRPQSRGYPLAHRKLGDGISCIPVRVVAHPHNKLQLEDEHDKGSPSVVSLHGHRRRDDGRNQLRGAQARSHREGGVRAERNIYGCWGRLRQSKARAWGTWGFGSHDNCLACLAPPLGSKGAASLP